MVSSTLPSALMTTRPATAHSLIHGQRAAGQRAVGEANGAVLEANPAPAELVLAFGHPGCFHGVGNESQALRALSLVGEAEGALVDVHSVRDYAHPNPIVGE